MLFRRERRPGALVSAIVLTVIAGCTSTPAPGQTPTSSAPSSGSASPALSPTPTPTPTWNERQSAAIKAVDDFDAVSTKIAADPAAFTRAEMTKLFEQSVGGDVLQRNVDSFMSMREKGYREVGSRIPVFTQATREVNDGKGAEIHVTRCWDQRELSVVTADGATVGTAKGDEGYAYPDYNLRQYTVLQPKGQNTFRVFGVQTINGACP